MQTQIEPMTGRGKMVLSGRVLSTLLTLFFVFDGVMKLVQPAPVMKASAQLGYSTNEVFGIGIALLVCTALYVIPRTAVLGAIVLTGYLGGAIASQLRISASLFSLSFPFLFCVLMWLGLYLRESRLRAIVPFRN
jgi:hypothetical protein